MSDYFQASAVPQVGVVDGYKPSGKMGPLAIPLLLVSLLVLPPLAALLYNSTAHFGGLFFSSPWILVITCGLLGALVGGALYVAIQWGKVRNVPVAVVVGLLAGLLTFAVSMGLEAWSHRDIINSVALQKGAARELSFVENAEVYWKAHAASGQQMSGRRGRGATISGDMFWALLGVQALLVCVVAGVVSALWAGRRFSEANDRWFASKNLWNVLPQHVPELVEAGNSGDWSRFHAVASLSKDPNFKEFKPPVTLYYLPGKPDAILEIRAVADPKKPVAAVFERKLSNEEAKILWPQFSAS